MPRTYSENSEPRKVYQADTIRGFTPEDVQVALKNGGNELENAQKFSTPLIVYNAAEMATALSGTTVSKNLDSLDGFVVEDNKIVKYPFYLPVEGENTTGLILPSLVGVSLIDSIVYHILLQAGGEVYLTAFEVLYVTDHIKVQVTAKQLTS